MLLTLGMFLVFGVGTGAQKDIVVSPTGADSNPGTERQPMASIAAARDRARLVQSHSIVVHGGWYRLTDSVVFDGRDSGLTLRASSGQHPLLMGGIQIPLASIHSCQNPAVLERIVEVDARKKVLEVDLAKLGLTNLPPIVARGFPHSGIQAPNELFQGDRPMTLARWPNTGFAKVGKVVEPGNGEHDHDKPMRRPMFSIGDRAKLWTSAEEPWMYGYWKYDWADESIRVHQIDPATGQITLEGPAVYGVDTGMPFFAENLLEELDAPGEYYIDRKASKLYFIPSHDLDPKEPLVLSMVDRPLVSISNAKGVTVRGLDFGFTRGDGTAVHNGEGVCFEACRFRNIGARAAEITGGHGSGLQSCDIRATGEGGVRLGGGDRKTLESGLNFVANCEFDNFERRSQTYRPAVWIDGVGNRVSHCYMHDAPHSAIIYGGNNHLIEFNHFSRLLSLTGDGGVIYTGRDWSARGTMITGNWFEDCFGQRKWEPAIYVDDLGSGIRMIDNLIERCHWGFLIGGGKDNELLKNVLVDCDLAFDCDARGLGWAANSRPTMETNLKAVPFDSAVWTSAYPTLPGILNDNPMAPSRNSLVDNLLIRAGTVTKQMEAAFKATATIEGNREVQQPSKDDLERIQKMQSSAGLVKDALRRSL